ncbi:MAG: hypothetical protein R3A10_11995 [Caldilineaceae bacterium]
MADRIAGAALPQPGGWSPHPDDALRFPALQLFAQGAGAVQPAFRLRDELDEAIGICHWLEGMPLGIKLAAAPAPSPAPKF